MEPIAVPFRWSVADGERPWTVEVEIDPDTGACVGFRVGRDHPLIERDPDLREVTSAVIRSIPIATVVRRARALVARRGESDAAMARGMALDYMLANEVLSELPDGRLVIPDGPPQTGPASAAGPRRRPTGEPGGPRLAPEFLREVAIVHAAAQNAGLPVRRVLGRYLHSRFGRPVPEETVKSYIRRARRENYIKS